MDQQEITEHVRFNHRNQTFRLASGPNLPYKGVIQRLDETGNWQSVIGKEAVMKTFTQIEITFLADALMACGTLGLIDGQEYAHFALVMASKRAHIMGFSLSSLTTVASSDEKPKEPVVNSRPSQGTKLN